MNSKAKGSAFERSICKQISLWLTRGAREDVLWRSSLSGGRATVAHRKGKVVRQAGDVAAVADEGWEFCSHYYIECKAYKKLGLDQFMIKGTGPLAVFWQKAQLEALKHNRIPILIAKQNGWPILVLSGEILSWATPYILVHNKPIITLFDVWMKNQRHPYNKIQRIPRE